MCSKVWSKLSILFGVLLVVAVVVGCAPAAAPSTPATPAAPAEPIKIGLVGAMNANYGLSHKAALEISIDEINAAGGILGRPLQLVIEDWKSQLPLAATAYKKLVTTDKCLLVYTETTDATIACQQQGALLFTEYPHLQFAVYTATDPVMYPVAKEYEKYKFSFRTNSTASDWWDPGTNFARLFSEVIGAKRVAYFYEDNVWGKAFRDGIAEKGYPPLDKFFESKGMTTTYTTTFATTEKMFLPIYEKIAASNPDTIFYVCGYSDEVTAIKQWSESAAKDIDIVAMGGPVGFKKFWDMTSGAALGVCMLDPEVMVPYTPKVKPFVDKLTAKGGGMASGTYGATDGPYILKAGIEKAGGTKDINALIKAIEGNEVQNVFWKWSYDKKYHEPRKGNPYFPMTYGQHQGPGKLIAVFDELQRSLGNPNDKYLRLKDLRAKMGK